MTEEPVLPEKPESPQEHELLEVEANEDIHPLMKAFPIVEVVERYVFGCIFVLLVLVAASPVVIRWLNNVVGTQITVPSFISVSIEQLVLVIALFGAASASRDRKHIAIDVVSPFLPRVAKLALRVFTQALAGCVVLYLVPGSFTFIGQEMERDATSRFFDAPIWIESALIPFGLVLIGTRLLLAASIDGYVAYRLFSEQKPTAASGGAA